MENADEYEEWISGRAFWAMNSVFNKYGLLFEEVYFPESIEDAIWPIRAIQTLNLADAAEDAFVQNAESLGITANEEKSETFFIELDIDNINILIRDL